MDLGKGFGGLKDAMSKVLKPNKMPTRKDLSSKKKTRIDEDGLYLSGSDFQQQSDEDAQASLYADDDNPMQGPQRQDILELLNIQANIPVPDDVLMPEDLDDLKLTITEPTGYSSKQVDELIQSFYDSLGWYVQTLQRRNKDIADLATQLDKTDTDLHNMKLSAEMSEGLTVMPGAKSTAEQELTSLQLKYVQLQDENKNLKQQLARGSGAGAGSSVDSVENQEKYAALQNQVALLQLENRKLKASARRSSMYAAANEEAQDLAGFTPTGPAAPGDDVDSLDVSNDPNAIQPGQGNAGGLPTPDFGGGLPTPGMDSQGGLPTPGMSDLQGGLPMPGQDPNGLPAPNFGSPASAQPSATPRAAKMRTPGRSPDSNSSLPALSFDDAAASESSFDVPFTPMSADDDYNVQMKNQSTVNALPSLGNGGMFDSELPAPDGNAGGLPRPGGAAEYGDVLPDDDMGGIDFSDENSVDIPTQPVSNSNDFDDVTGAFNDDDNGAIDLSIDELE